MTFAQRRPFAFRLWLVAITIAILLSHASPTLRAQDLGERAESVQRSTTRSEADEDRLTAVALFSAARMLEQRQDLPAALRRYQRAFRYDSKSAAALREIIPLAFSLSREEEAVRYATKLASLDASDSVLLRRLGVVLTEQGSIADALSLYEKARQLELPDDKSSAAVMLRLEMGRLYFLSSKFDRSAAMFEFVAKAIEQPDDYGLNAQLLKTIVGDKGEMHELMATAFLEGDRPVDAAAAFARLDKFSPNKAVQAYNEALVLAKSDKPDEALQKLQVYLDTREAGKGSAPYELLSKLLDKQKKSDELVTRLEKQLADQQANIPLNFALAEEYRKLKKLKESAKLYNIALSKQPTSQAYRRLVEVYRELGDYAELAKLLGDVVGKSGSLEIVAKPVKSLAEDAAEVKQLAEIAIEKFGEAKPENHSVLRAAGMVAAEAKQFETAGKLFDLAIKAKPSENAEVLLVWGLQLFLNEKYGDAVRVFQRGIDEKALPESNPAFYFYLAGAQAMNKQTDAALAAARAAVEKKPGSPRFESRIAWIHYQAKHYDEAVKQYEKLIEKYDTDFASSETRDVMHDSRLILSNIAVFQNRLSDAEEWVEQVLDEFPDDIGAHNDLGYLWADANKHLVRAERMIRRAVEAEPENSAYRDSLGWALYRLGKFDDALKEQLQAVAQRDKQEQATDGVMFDHLGDIYHKLNQRDKAVEAWQQAASAFEKELDQEKLAATKKKLAP